MADISALEDDFFAVLSDLEPFLPRLTLVGGWVPYIYSRFLWTGTRGRPVFTSDIDWGLGAGAVRVASKTLFDALSPLDYKERHEDIGRLYPVVLYKRNRMRLDFIAPPGPESDAARRLLGREISLSRLDGFDFLLKNRIRVNVKKGERVYGLFCPSPSAFICHKCSIFTQRDDAQKMAKDLYYAYFILRFVPDRDSLFSAISDYHDEPIIAGIKENLSGYFSHKTSKGCAMVARENGPDPYLEDLSGDIWEKFSFLLKAIK